jgi:hypothetical protein
MDHREEAERILASRRHAHSDTAAVGILHAVLAMLGKDEPMDTYTTQEIRDAAKRMSFERSAESLITTMRRLQEAATLTRADDDTITRKRMRDAIARLREKGRGSMLSANEVFAEDQEWEQRKHPEPQEGEVWETATGLFQRTGTSEWVPVRRDEENRLYKRAYLTGTDAIYSDAAIRPVKKVSE